MSDENWVTEIEWPFFVGQTGSKVSICQSLSFRLCLVAPMKRKEKWKYQENRKEKKKTNSWPYLVFKENGKENICFTFIRLTIWFATSIRGHISNFIIKKVKITQIFSSFPYLSMSFGMRVSLVPQPFLQLFHNLSDLWTVELWTYMDSSFFFPTIYHSPIWQIMAKVVKIGYNSKLTLWDDNKMLGPIEI